MFSDGVPYSFEHVIVDGKLRPALRTVMELSEVFSKLVFLSSPTFSPQCLSSKRRAVVGRDSMFDGEEEHFCQGVRDVLRGKSPTVSVLPTILVRYRFEMHTPKT